jgi:hypothetical protein
MNRAKILAVALAGFLLGVAASHIPAKAQAAGGVHVTITPQLVSGQYIASKNLPGSTVVGFSCAHDPDQGQTGVMCYVATTP